MDARVALDMTAKGMRKRLGSFAPVEYMKYAVALLEGSAEELAEVGSLEAGRNTDDESMTPESLIRQVAERRVAALVGNNPQYKSICDHGKHCLPGCQHVLKILVLPDSAVRDIVSEAMHSRNGDSFVMIGSGAAGGAITDMLRGRGLLPSEEDGMPEPEAEPDPE